MSEVTILQLVTTTMEFAAIFLLSFSIFRIPFRYLWGKIILVSFILSCVAISLVFFQQENFSLIASVSLYVIFTILVFNFPIFYALIVCVTGYLIYAIIQLLITVVALSLNLATYSDLTSSESTQLIMQVVSVLIVTLLVVWLQAKKIGFMFVSNRYTTSKVKGSNILLSLIILLCFFVLQLSFDSFNKHSSLLYSTIGLIFILIVGLFLTYKKNRKELLEKYRRLNKS